MQGRVETLEINTEYLRVCTEREIPFSELLAVADDIWDKSPEEQDSIRELKAKEFAAKYPYKEGREPQK